MHRFFLPSQCIHQNQVLFPGDISRQLNLVLRLKPGATVIVLDGKGMEYQTRLLEVSSTQATGEVVSTKLSTTEPKTKLTLLLCLTQREKFEWMLQKCTEIGASTFVPVISSRSLVQSSREVDSKLERWQRILREAAEQSHRGQLPELRMPVRFEEVIRGEEWKHDCRLIPWEEEKSLDIRTALQKNSSERVTLAIGPEGGFAEEEVSAAKLAGFIPVSLGPRILRMETAAIAAAAIVLYELGDMNARSDQAAGEQIL
jgi:16S rRNA (uracil1498-N3)-methyltransferase